MPDFKLDGLSPLWGSDTGAEKHPESLEEPRIRHHLGTENRSSCLDLEESGQTEKLWGLVGGREESEIPSKCDGKSEKIFGVLMLGTSLPIRIFFASVLPGAVRKEEGNKQKVMWSVSWYQTGKKNTVLHKWSNGEDM